MANGNIDFTAAYDSPVPYPTPSHLAGVWETPTGVSLRFVSDIGQRNYSVRSPSGIHLRSFHFTTPVQTASMDLEADEYQLANRTWADNNHSYSIVADRATLPSVRLQGTGGITDATAAPARPGVGPYQPW